MKRLPDKPENPSDPRKVSVVLLKEENSDWSPCPGIGDTNLNEKDFVSEFFSNSKKNLPAIRKPWIVNPIPANSGLR